MSWRALITDDDERDQVVEVIREIARAHEGAPFDTVNAYCDEALLRVYLDKNSIVPDLVDLGSAALVRAVDMLRGAPLPPGLFGGLSRVGWALGHLGDQDSTAEACNEIDAALLELLEDTWGDHYDLISGLVGVGVYALERGPASAAVLRRVLELMERLARPRRGGVAWHTKPKLLPPWQREIAPDGYWDLGLAHGAPGVVAFLSQCIHQGYGTQRVHQLLSGAITYLLALGPSYPSWEVGEVRNGSPPTRLAWCYNDLSVAVALFQAAQVEQAWLPHALALAKTCAARSFDDAHIADAAICHGAAGVAHIFNRLYQASDEELLGAAALRWIRRILAMRGTADYAGFPSVDKVHAHGAHEWRPDASLLTGTTGVALVLQAAAFELEPLWDRLLLLNLTPRAHVYHAPKES